MTRNVLLKDPKDFAVRIRHCDSNAVVGTGIAVSLEGDIVTCTHAIKDSGASLIPGSRVPVSYGGIPDERDHIRWTVLLASSGDDADDVALLRLEEGLAPLRPEQIADLGSADASTDNPFKAYGYRKLAQYQSGRSDGVIQGSVEPAVGRRCSVDPIQLACSQINQGMSGAGVLDRKRNMVVGVISETWFPDASTKDRDTAWAVDAQVLGKPPFNLPLRDTPVLPSAAPPPVEAADIDFPDFPYDLARALRTAPAPLPETEWVPRPELEAFLNNAWGDPDCLVTGLVGFGGEGKSALVRNWVDTLMDDPVRVPAKAFWWDFRANPGIDAFIGAALSALGGADLARTVQQTPQRLKMLSTLVRHGPRFLLVLDALETAQQDTGDDWGAFKDPGLSEFVEAFATPEHGSLCVITSRVPLVDLERYTTYRDQEVTTLAPQQAITLMRNLGAPGTDPELEQTAARWGGHALTLSLLGPLLAQHSAGADLPSPLDEHPDQARLHFLLSYYDRHLSTAERSFLSLASTIRSPVGKRHFDQLFRHRIDGVDVNLALTELDDGTFSGLLKRLVGYHILRHDWFTDEYGLHSLVREYYYERFYPPERAQAHRLLAGFHLREADLAVQFMEELGDITGLPLTGWQIGDASDAVNMRFEDQTIPLDPLGSRLEALYHALQAGDYEPAYNIYYQGIQEERWRLPLEMGAFATDLAALAGFFPDGDFDREPLIDDPAVKAILLNQVGYDLMQLGEPGRAATYLRRSAELDREHGNRANLFNTLINLFQVLVQSGKLGEAGQIAKDMQALAPDVADHPGGSLFCAMVGLAAHGWVAHLLGNTDEARKLFAEAEKLQVEREPDASYLYSDGGLWYIAHLLDDGRLDDATVRVEFNLWVADQMQQVQAFAVALRLRGELAQRKDDPTAAREHYDRSIEICTNTGLRFELANVRLSSGCLALATGDTDRAKEDLTAAESLSCAKEFRLVEARVRMALAILKTATGQPEQAAQQQATARRLAVECGFALDRPC